VTRFSKTLLLGTVLLVTAAVSLIVGLVDSDDDPASAVPAFSRLAFDAGGGTVNLGTGGWVGYYEAPARTGSTVPVPNFRAFIRDPRGAQVNVGNYGDGSAGARPLTYDYRGRRGVAVLRFDTTQAGRYRVQLQTAGGSATGADLAIGRDLAAPAAASHAPYVVGGIAAIAGIAVLAWGFVQRSRRPHVVSGAT
jgi:hypothetical protein